MGSTRTGSNPVHSVVIFLFSSPSRAVCVLNVVVNVIDPILSESRAQTNGPRGRIELLALGIWDFANPVHFPGKKTSSLSNLPVYD